MAVNLPKVHEPQTAQTASEAESSTARQRSNPSCSCTNISIMQLFHEMKQEFPTVPDNVVSECVMDNCHNRTVCIENLRQKVLGNPNLVQTYPVQSLRKNKVITSSSTKWYTDTNIVSLDETLIPSGSQRSFHSINHTEVIASDMNQSSNSSDNKSIAPQRPTTLNISKDPINISSGTQNFLNRPMRVAPPPPLQQAAEQNVQSILSDSNESINVSLNVTVSPVSGRPPVRPPRHTSAISMQPEAPYLRDVQQNPRSYTSVNFTLRQPSTSPQSPIDISAGSSLTYSSSSFDARQGYQSRFQITVGNGGGSISAVRTRPQSCYNMPAMADIEDEFGTTSTIMRAGVSMPNVAQERDYSEAEVVHRQLLFKQKLSAELENDRKRLDMMQREIKALQAPLPPGGSSLLQVEIEQLRCECKRMAVEVEEAGNFVLGETDEAFYQNIYTGQRLPSQTRPPKPPRPPPPVALRSISEPSASNQFSMRPNDNGNNNYMNTNAEGPSWTCNMCTFRNHPLLDKCEQCDMPRIPSSGTVQITASQFKPRLQNVQLLQSAARSPCSVNTNDNSNNTNNACMLPMYQTNYPTNVLAIQNSFSNNNNNNNKNNNNNDNNLSIMAPKLEETSSRSSVIMATNGPLITHRHSPSM